MAFAGTWQVELTRKERVTITATDALEAEIWADIEGYGIDVGLSREQYEKLDTKKKAEFLASLAATWGGNFLDYCEPTGCDICEVVSEKKD